MAPRTSLWLLASSLGLIAGLTACGDVHEIPAVDLGTDAGRDAATLCTASTQCSDGLWCNGAETCAPGTSGADARGCVAGTPPSCALGSVCDESTDACDGCASIDNDGDGESACTDCDDNDPNRYHGNTEVCDYPVNKDEDCDPTTFGSKDDDGDGYVDARCCNGASCGTDCDDTRGGVHPGVPEVCNGRDDDCNGLIDDDGVQVQGYLDADRDLYGAGSLIWACAGPGLSAVGTDCDDVPPGGGSASPALQEVLGDGIDNDCDGVIDETGGAPALWYLDADGDGYGTGAPVSSATVLVGYALLAGDCDDTNAAINPAAAEQCNGLDDNCNGLADYRLGVNDFEDDDGDGYVDVACGGPANDCDDGDPATYPGAPELCDGRDNDCDGVVDEGACGVSVDGGVVDAGVRDSGAVDLGVADMGAADAGPPPTVCIPGNPTIVVRASFSRGLTTDGYNTTWATVRHARLSGGTPGPGYIRCDPSGPIFDAYVQTRAVGAYRFLDGSSLPGAGILRMAVQFPAVPLPAGAHATSARLLVPRAGDIPIDSSYPLDLHVVTFDRSGIDVACSDHGLERWGAATLGHLANANLAALGSSSYIALSGPALARIEARTPFELGIRAGADLQDIEPSSVAAVGQYTNYFVPPECRGTDLDCMPEAVQIEVTCSFDPPPTCAWNAPFESVTKIAVAIPAGGVPAGLAVANNESEIWLGTSPAFDLYSLHRPGDEDFVASSLSAGAEANAQPFLTRDGLSLFWSRGAPTMTTADIFTATRATLAAPFGPAAAVAAVNSAAAEESPWVTAGGMYISRGRLYFAARSGGSFAAPTPLALTGPGTASKWPVVTDDDLTIYWSETLAGGDAGEIYVAHRATLGAAFGTPQRVVGVPSFPASDESPHWISPDSCRMYLVAQGQMYVATRTPI
jgi:hypothetical protein